MGKILSIDCLKCTNRFDWDVTTDQICPRCQTLQSGDVTKILAELKKVVIPGQKPILDCLEALNSRLMAVENLAKLTEGRQHGISLRTYNCEVKLGLAPVQFETKEVEPHVVTPDTEQN